MKIAYLVNDVDFFISHRLELAIAARRRNHEIYVIGPESEGSSRLKELGFHFLRIDLTRRGINPITEIRSLIQIFKTILAIDPDIVHAIALKASLYMGVLARKFPQKKILLAITGLGSAFIGRTLKYLIIRQCITILIHMGLSAKNIFAVFQNQDDLDHFIKKGWLSKRHTVLIPGAGVDLDKYRPSEEIPGPPIILFPGRIIGDKGVYDLIEAIRILKRNSALEFKVILAGKLDPGNPSYIPENVVRGWEREGLIRWLGLVSDMSKLFRECHLVCLPSYREGVPLALLESAASGRAIITTDAPGCREVVKEGVNGFLVPIKSPVILAQKLESLLKDKSKRNSFGRLGREFAVEKFSKEQIISATLKLYTTGGELC